MADKPMKPIATDYFLALRPEPDRPGGPTAPQRVRQLLKIALRSFGLKCISIGPALPAESIEEQESKPCGSGD
jgi:hypothetical protein